MKLEDLPPHLRLQAERQLAVHTVPHLPTAKPPVVVSPKSTPAYHSPAQAHVRPLPLDKQPVLSQDLTTISQVQQDAKKAKRRHKQTLTPDRAKDIVKSVTQPSPNEVRITLAVNPAEIPTAQQKGAFVGKDGRVHFFTKAHIAKAEKTIVKAMEPYADLTRKWGHVPYEVEFDYYFPYASSTPKKQIHKIGPMNERPDASNITKGICDSLTEAGMWEDDSLINTEISKKRRTTGPSCIVIKIKNLQPQFDELYRQTKEYDAPTLFTSSTTAPVKPSETNPITDLQNAASSQTTQPQNS